MIDTHELGRRPGAMTRVHRTVPAPEELGNVVIGVPAGSDLELDLRLEAVMEGVLVTGTVHGRATGECARCLRAIETDVDIELQELFAYPDKAARAGDDDEEHELEGNLLDLERAVRDVAVPALPFQPLCQDDCPGLCSECGARLADDPGHLHEHVDPRWSALQGLASADRTDDQGRAAATANEED